MNKFSLIVLLLFALNVLLGQNKQKILSTLNFSIDTTYQGGESLIVDVFKSDTNIKTLIKINETFYDSLETITGFLNDNKKNIKRITVINDSLKISKVFQSSIPYKRILIIESFDIKK